MKFHQLSTYNDNWFKVSFCRVCGAEGLMLLENCPEKFIDMSKKALDEKKPIAK